MRGARVLSISRAINELPDMRRYRLIIIDESQNLRNREGKRYRAIQEYIRKNDSKCILLSATPYNKTYLDLSSQLRLFVPETEDLGIRPERLLREIGGTEFIRRHQAPVRSLAASDKSEHADDWRELMRLYLVRRTRGFIQDNYAATDPRAKIFDVRGRLPVLFSGFAFPKQFGSMSTNNMRGYSRTTWWIPSTDWNSRVTVSAITWRRRPIRHRRRAEAKVLDDLSRAGKRLMGFCRTNLPIPMKAATDSEGKRPPVPIQNGHFGRGSNWAS